MSFEPSAINYVRRHVMNDKLVHLMAELKEKETIAMFKELIKEGADPMEILDAARSAMELVGKRFESGEYFIPDLFMAGGRMKGNLGEVGRRHALNPVASK